MICPEGEVLRKFAARQKDKHKCTLKLSAQGCHNRTSQPLITCNPKLGILRPSMDQEQFHISTNVARHAGFNSLVLCKEVCFDLNSQFKISTMY